MTRADLISSLYRHFRAMQTIWMDFSRANGVGALMFFAENYEPARDFSEVKWEFWERNRLLDYIYSGLQEKTHLQLEEGDFLTRMNETEFLSVVVRGDASSDRFEIEIHRIDSSLLN